MYTFITNISSCITLHGACIISSSTKLAQLITLNNSQEIKRYTFIFSKRLEHYIQEVLPHSFIHSWKELFLICHIDLYCVIAIFNGTGDMFNR